MNETLVKTAQVANVQPDRLCARIDIYHENIMLTEFDSTNHHTVKQISAQAVADIFTRHMGFSSGFLPPNCLWWKHSHLGQTVGLWQPPRQWNIALVEKPLQPPTRLKLPMPGFLFVCVPGSPPWIFATKKRPTGPDSTLYRAPTFNVFGDGRVCPGTHQFPQNVEEIPESFFQSFFSPEADIRERSVSHPERLEDLWKELDGKTRFPNADLVYQGTVREAMQLPESNGRHI